MRRHEYFMRTAIHLANVAAKRGEVPIGSVVVLESDCRIIGYGYNLTETANCSLEHAEMRAIRAASKKLDSWRLNLHGDVTLYTTIEPCTMCLGASKLSRVSSIVYGAKNDKYSSISKIECTDKLRIVGGVLEEECKLPMRSFFKKKRKGVKS
jgi:tRNA(adenine34) deaminase